MDGIKSISTLNSYGKIGDFLQMRKEYQEKNGAKLVFAPKTVYYSTDVFIPSEFMDSSNIVKSSNPNKQPSGIDGGNQIDFRTGKPIELGDYDGYSVELKNWGGWIDSSLGVPDVMASKPGQRQSPLEQRAAEMAKHISYSKQVEIAKISNAINNLAKVADGKLTIHSISNEDNKYIKLALEKMGVDLSKPFAFNGEKFHIRDDNGKVDYLNTKRYVKREDGKIEIQEVSN